MRSFLMIALLATAACSGAKEEAPAVAETATVDAPALPPDVNQAIMISKAIAANPAASDSIFAVNNLTAAGFDALLYNIAADSAKSRLYNAARQ
jgi:hypothetical protein